MMGSCMRGIKFLEKEDKKTFLMKSGENLLEKLILTFNGKGNPIRSFSVEEIKTATSNYDLQNVIPNGLVCKLYNGFLHGRSVSVMKFQNNDKFDAYEWCLKNIIFASQLRHINFLKLIGYCLEIKISILVFESVSYGTLANFIHDPRPSDFEPLLLTRRLKIATEITNALAYLLVGFPRPIVFKNIKLSSILYGEEQHVAKLFDFSVAESIPEGETRIEDTVPIGIMVLVAPEYVTAGYYNEKCDVFSFGVLLLVILTGKRMYFIDEAEDHYLLIHQVRKHIESNKFDELVDPVIRGDSSRQSSGKEQQLQSFIELALKCVCESAEGRPTMIDIEKQLRQVYRSF